MSEVEEDVSATERDSKNDEKKSEESAVKEETAVKEESTVKDESAVKDEAANQEKTAADGNNANEESQTVVKDNTKIDILLKATGNAPIMKKKKWTVNPDQHIGWISDFIKRYLKLDSSERLFLYINQTFAPAPDQTVKNLYDCYGTDGKLIIHYCKSQAWG